jgi:hypothetical protein
MPAPFAILIPVGPGEKEIERLRDFFDALFFFEPSVACILFVDDVRPARRLEREFTFPAGCRVETIANPRKGRGNGWSGGLAAGVLAGFQWITANTAVEFALKMDTDALVIAPFADKIAQAFRDRPEVSMLGSFSGNPNRRYDLPEDYSTAPAMIKLQKPVTVWRRTCDPWPRVQCGLFKRDRLRGALIRRAVTNGYRLGAHCQGGAYAVHMPALRRLQETGVFDEPLLWIWTPCSEDIAMTVSVYACGGAAGDLNGKDEPFGVQSQGLPAEPRNLVERGFSIIHSVKDFHDAREADTRAFFQARRNQHP